MCAGAFLIFAFPIARNEAYPVGYSKKKDLKDDRDAKVFRHESGTIERVDPADVAPGKCLVLPPLLRVNKVHSDQLKTKNKFGFRARQYCFCLD
jgi:hypothetical protein